MKVNYALQSEIVMQNAYPEATDLLQKLAEVQEDGSVKIRGVDSNGVSTLLDIKEGVAQFLKTKPYLVKAGNQGGSGSGNTNVGGGDGNTPTGEVNIATLNAELAQAMTMGNQKKAKEITQKIKDYQSSRGITSII